MEKVKTVRGPMVCYVVEAIQFTDSILKSMP
jgi:hypothetical protein